MKYENQRQRIAAIMQRVSEVGAHEAWDVLSIARERSQEAELFVVLAEADSRFVVWFASARDDEAAQVFSGEYYHFGNTTGRKEVYKKAVADFTDRIRA